MLCGLVLLELSLDISVTRAVSCVLAPPSAFPWPSPACVREPRRVPARRGGHGVDELAEFGVELLRLLPKRRVAAVVEHHQGAAGKLLVQVRPQFRSIDSAAGAVAEQDRQVDARQ